MHSINGVQLDDPARGWVELDLSELVAGTAISRPSLTRPGIDGSVPMPGTLDTPAVAVAVSCRKSALATLRAVFLQPTLNLGRAGTYGTAVAELKAITAVPVTGGTDPEMEVKAVLELPGVWYRGDVETFTKPLAAASEALSVFPGITGKVTDALVRFTGCTDPKATDAAGSFVAYTGTIADGAWLRIDTATGRGWTTTTDVWTGGTEVDPLALTFGKGPGFLTITPSFTDPATRAGALTVTTTARTAGATASIQGRNAYHA